MGLPGALTKKRFFQKKWAPDLFEVIGVIMGFAPVTVQAWINWNYPDPKTSVTERTLSYIGFIGLGFVLGKGASKLYQNYIAERGESEAHLDGIVAGLQILHSIVRHMHGFPRHEHDRLRVTLYRVADSLRVPGEKELEQIVEYVGAGDNRTRKGRRFSIRCGLIGKVARSGDPRGASRETDNHEEYLRELEVEWNFTREEAVKLSSGRNSFFAVPITSRNEVTAVVYMDSSERNFFPDNVKQRVIVACLGLAVFINGRYYNE